MGTLTVLWNNGADNANVTGGAWATALPLTNLLASNITKVARTTDAQLASAQFKVEMADAIQIKAIVVGPTNLTTNYQYRISWYSDELFTTLTDTTGWINPFGTVLTDPFDIPWEASYFWDGVEPFDDKDRGIWVIHVFESPIVTLYIKVELDDRINPDGYIQAGRLFIGSYWAPSLNYTPDNNGLSFRNANIESSTLRGGKHYWRRINPRSWACSISMLPELEAYTSAYDLIQQAGYDKEVFVIPDPEDSTNMQRRAFLATITQADPISQALVSRASFGFTVEEIVQ